MEKTLREIVDYAVWAPSGDNSQPWSFRILSDRIQVYIDPDKDNPILNFELSGTFISAGAVLENIRIAASHYGLDAKFKIFPDTTNKTFVADISFQKKTVTEDTLFKFIKDRCTNRKAYKNTPLTIGQKQKLVESAKAVPEAKLVMIENPQLIKKVANACSITEKIALETPALHKLFFKNLVWSREEEQRKGIGLYAKTLELPILVLWLFKILKYWRVVNILNAIGFSKLAAKGNAKTYARSAALCAVAIERPTPHGFVFAGRLMQRVWLTTTSLGLSMQPVTGVFFFIMRWREGKTSDFLPQHLPEIRKAYETIYPALGLTNETIVMHMRVGIADTPTARSLRIQPKIMLR